MARAGIHVGVACRARCSSRSPSAVRSEASRCSVQNLAMTSPVVAGPGSWMPLDTSSLVAP
eukprot:10049618-Lingulodinium_polyedra.AAC.1